MTILTLCVTSISAQTPSKGTTFAIIGGINFQNLNGKNSNGDKLNNKIIPGLHIGFNAMIPLVPEFYFQPGLLFSTKGSINKQDSFSNKYNLAYIEMPLNFVYKATLGKGFFMLGFGPYLAYGLRGQRITKYNNIETTTDIKFKHTVEINEPVNPPSFRAFDAGANLFAGYALVNGIFFQLNTQLGMVKINPENKNFSNDQTIIKNTGFGLSLGYRF